MSRPINSVSGSKFGWQWVAVDGAVDRGRYVSVMAKVAFAGFLTSQAPQIIMRTMSGVIQFM